MTPRPYQVDALNAVAKSYADSKKRVVVKLPTGMGKTVIFALAPKWLKLGRRIMVLVHRDELAKQAADKIKRSNPQCSVGIEMGSSYAGDARFVVGSVQTLGKRGSNRLNAFNPSDFDMLVIDECHHATGDSYRRVVDYLNTFTLGVSATINRADGRGLNEVFEEITYSYSMLDGIKNGWLAPMRGVRVALFKGLDKVNKRAGDLDKGQLASVVNTPECNAQLVAAWRQHASDRQTVVFCVDVKHAQDLAAAFVHAGVKAAAIWGEDPDRSKKLEDHSKGKLQVVVNCEVLTEGYDDWTIGCVMLARPTYSESLYTQMVGRGSRIQDGIGNYLEAVQKGIQLRKTDLLVLDCVGNSKRHSLITLPSLFGLNPNMDLKGKNAALVAQQIEEITATRPGLDSSKLLDADTLEHTVEQFDMFNVECLPDTIQISEYLWRKSSENTYVLLLKGNESACVTQDSGGTWRVVGRITNQSGNTCTLCKACGTFEEAIKEADYSVRMLGGKGLESQIKVKATWHDLPPDAAQLIVLKRWGIKPFPGATRGDVHKFIRAELVRRGIQKTA